LHKTNDVSAKTQKVNIQKL